MGSGEELVEEISEMVVATGEFPVVSTVTTAVLGYAAAEIVDKVYI